jgi:hypothetical protein
MSRRGRSGRKAKAARQRASTTARSNAVRATGSPTTTGDWPQPIVLGRQRNPCDACARLRKLATARDEAQAAVDLEVTRLRQIGLGWVPIAAALKMSRQGARQRYGRAPAQRAGPPTIP